jgi:hypothetical protein
MKLEGILLFLFAGASILFACVALVLSVVCLLALSHIERMRRRGSSARSAFVKELLRGLANKTIRDLSDMHNSYRAFIGIGTLRVSHLEELAEFLRSAMLRTASVPHESSRSDPEERTQLLQELLAGNQRVLEVEQHCVPFSGSPEPERKLMEEILELPATDKTSVRAKLDMLAKAIRIREDTVERFGRERDRSLQLARWGWFGTVGFSLLSIILAILALGR